MKGTRDPHTGIPNCVKDELQELFTFVYLFSDLEKNKVTAHYKFALTSQVLWGNSKSGEMCSLKSSVKE